MTDDEFKALERGDIVRPAGEFRSFVVTGVYGDRVTAACTVDVTNPGEWQLFAGAQRVSAEIPPAALERARDAVLANLRDRRLIKYLFADDPGSRGAYGHVDRPLDIDVQHELVDTIIRKALEAVRS